MLWATARCSETSLSLSHPHRAALGKPTGPAATPPSYDCPGFPALLLRVGVSITMYISKPELTIEELLADPVMLTMLQHSRTTADDVRALLNGVRERLAKASAADTSDAPVASSELPAVGALS